jgi:hypothetical protein
MVRAFELVLAEEWILWKTIEEPCCSTGKLGLWPLSIFSKKLRPTQSRHLAFD